MLTEIKPHMPNTQGAVVAILQADKKSPANKSYSKSEETAKALDKLNVTNNPLHK